MTRRISFLNYKGGVGKTSIVVNVAACLVRLKKRVLVVDCDAQSNASIWLMRLDRWNVLNANPRCSLYSVFSDEPFDAEACLQRDVVLDAHGRHLLPGLDLLPTTFNLMELEDEYVEQTDRPSYGLFYERLKPLFDQYDYVLFDCPPNFFRSTKCAVFASNEIYVPVNPDALSLIGFSLMVDKMTQFHRRTLEQHRHLQTPLAQVCGLIVNAVKKSINVSVPLQRMVIRLEHYREQRKASPNAQLFKVPVRHAIAVGRSVIMGLPVVILSRKHGSEGIREDYIRITSMLNSLKHDYIMLPLAQKQNSSQLEHVS